MQPSLFHSSVFPGVVPHTALVDIVGHCVVTSPPRHKTLKKKKKVKNVNSKSKFDKTTHKRLLVAAMSEREEAPFCVQNSIKSYEASKV